MNKTEFNNI